MDGSIKFNVSADTAQFQSGMRQVDDVAKKTAGSIGQSFAGLGTLLAGGAVVAGLQSVIDKFSRIQDLATRFGTSAEAIQRVGFAAGQAGTSIEDVARAMTKAGLAAVTAVREGGAAAEVFQRAGINAKEFAAADLDKKLLMVAQAYKAAGNDADKTSAIIEIMGTKGGANLIPLISNADELAKAMAGVKVASNETVASIEAAGDQLEAYKNQLMVLAADGIGAYVKAVERATAATHALATGQNEKGLGQTVVDLTSNFVNLAPKIGLTGAAAAALAIEFDDVGKTAMGASIDTTTAGNAITAGFEDSTVAAKDYGEEAAKAHEKAIKAAENETAALAKVQTAWEDAQQAAAQTYAAKERDLAQMELQASDPAAARRQADSRAAFEMFPSNNELDAENRARYIAAQESMRGQSGGGGGGGGSPIIPTPQDRFNSLTTTDPSALAAQLRSDFEKNKALSRAGRQAGNFDFNSAARTMLTAEERAQEAQMNALVKSDMKEQFGTTDPGAALREYNKGKSLDDQIKGGTDQIGGEYKSADQKFADMMREKAMTDQEKRSADVAAGGGGGGSAAPADPMAGLATTVKDILTALVGSNQIRDRLPVRVLA